MKTAKLVMSVILGAAAVWLAPGAAWAQTRIVIDAGHGGTDPGGVGNGLQEKAIVLDVASRFKALLDADTADTSGGGRWVALLTRSNDTFVSLAARASFSNNQDADRFMSIHSNAFSTASANGTETFSFAEGSTGAALRNLVQAEMIAAWATTNRGNKTANFAVLRDTAAPAVLHELAFITNAADAAKLASATMRQRAAVAHLRAVQRHFGITPHVPAALALPETPTPSESASGDAESAGPAVPDPAPAPSSTGTAAGEPDDVDLIGDGADAGCAASGRSGLAGAGSALVLFGLAAIRRRRRRS